MCELVVVVIVFGVFDIRMCLLFELFLGLRLII